MATNLFDANLYRSLYPDLARAGLTTDAQLRDHFLAFGANEGRIFSNSVNLKYYGSSYPDLTRAGITSNRQLFDHAEQFGAAEGRRLGVAFNPVYYKAVNPDLQLANLNNEQLAQHYENFGIKEGRRASEFFDPVYYLNNYADLKSAFGNNYEKAEQHFLNFGIREGRLGSGAVAPAFDPGSSASDSYELGTLVTKPTLIDFVGISDPEDYYRIILDKPSNLNLTLGGLGANTTLKLYADVNGNDKIEAGEELMTASGSNTAVINKNLAQGDYFVDVVTGSPVGGTSYSLNFAASALPTTTSSDPGNTTGNALDVGTLSGTRTYQDFVGTTDQHDFYRFVLDKVSNLSLSLSGISEYATVATANLYADINKNGALDPGEYLASTPASASGIGSITRNLGPGNYFVDITTSPMANTTYTLSLTA